MTVKSETIDRDGEYWCTWADDETGETFEMRRSELIQLARVGHIILKIDRHAPPAIRRQIVLSAVARKLY